MPMIEQPSRPIQTENGPRYAQQLHYKDHLIEVATGYDVLGDSWPYHVYLVTNAGRKKVQEGKLEANSQREAFAEGLQHGIAAVDSLQHG